MFWPFLSRRSWLDTDYLHNLVQDVPRLSQSLTSRFSRSSRWRRCPACRLPVEDSAFVVHTRRLSQDSQHCSQISASCGEIVLYQWDSSSFPPRVSPSWRSYFHQNATLVKPMLCFRSSLSLRISLCQNVLNSNCVLWASPCCKMHSNPSAIGDWSAIFDTKLIFGFWFRNHTFLFSRLLPAPASSTLF